jgi:hypothetical protein
LFCFVRYGLGKVVRKKNSGQLQRKVGKFGQTPKIIIFVCTPIGTEYLIDLVKEILLSKVHTVYATKVKQHFGFS